MEIVIKNEIYEQDYAAEFSKRVKADEITDFIDQLRDAGLFRFYQALMQLMPKVVIPKDCETYKRLLGECDKVAKQYGGKIYGIIDYEQWEARLTLTLPVIEFIAPKDLLWIQDISENVAAIWFQPTKDNQVEMQLLINYFEEVPPDENDIDAMRALAKQAAEQAGIEFPPNM